MTLHLPADILDEIAAHATSTYPEECCGFLIGSESGGYRVSAVLRAKNVAPAPRTSRYTIDPLAIVGAEKRAASEGMMVIGYYHSHPDHPSVPSEFDRSHAWPSYSYLILRVMRGVPAGFRSWRLEQEGRRFLQEVVEVG
jgi:proteasome lid subunit RPN8/RPN11